MVIATLALLLCGFAAGVGVAHLLIRRAVLLAEYELLHDMLYESRAHGAEFRCRFALMVDARVSRTIAADRGSRRTAALLSPGWKP